MEGVSCPPAFLLETLSAAMASDQTPPQYSRLTPSPDSSSQISDLLIHPSAHRLLHLLTALSTCLRQAFKRAHVPVVVQALVGKEFPDMRQDESKVYYSRGGEGHCHTLGWLPDSQGELTLVFIARGQGVG